MRVRNNRTAFTLVELIVVMALLVVFLAVSAPAISQSFKHQALKQESARLLALTEYARNEAVSQGAPMIVWIDPQSRSFGARAKDGSLGLQPGATTRGATGTQAGVSREKEFVLAEGMRFELGQARVGRDGLAILAEFEPDGTPDSASLDWAQIVDLRENAMTLSLAEDGWGYQIEGDDQ